MREGGGTRTRTGADEYEGQEDGEGANARAESGAVLFFRDRRGMPAVG